MQLHSSISHRSENAARFTNTPTRLTSITIDFRFVSIDTSRAFTSEGCHWRKPPPWIRTPSLFVPDLWKSEILTSYELREWVWNLKNIVIFCQILIGFVLRKRICPLAPVWWLVLLLHTRVVSELWMRRIAFNHTKTKQLQLSVKRWICWIWYQLFLYNIIFSVLHSNNSQ